MIVTVTLDPISTGIDAVSVVVRDVDGDGLNDVVAVFARS